MDNTVLNNTLGALEIGILVSYMLFGVTTAQTYIYYHHFPDDSPKLKAMVAFVWVCESAHAICIGNGLYTYTIVNYGKPERLAYAFPKSLLVGAFLTSVISAIVQGFFVFRTNLLTKKLYLCLIISVMIFLRLLAISAVFSLGLGVTLLVPFEAQWGWLLIVGLAISAATDLTIAVVLTVSLRNQSRGVCKRTMALVDKLIAWTIETAAITSVSTILKFIFFITMKHNFIWLAVLCELPTGQASLLATLREMDQVTVTLPSLPAVTQPPCTGMNIVVTKTSEVLDDASIQCGSDPEELGDV
ncbi:hypothetical protein MSAN_00208800 [Mycena sanguinolenta]|uniref:DUF6534 domain-containing protein n=1 Tax=Mycena sanguinolenta TaxID=230812 RepID=A0A8H6ZHG2_9AGAR|nr:hypothetical protein MSAN_00208800 [Mycena sanguinolenta]